MLSGHPGTAGGLGDALLEDTAAPQAAGEALDGDVDGFRVVDAVLVKVGGGAVNVARLRRGERMVLYLQVAPGTVLN